MKLSGGSVSTAALALLATDKVIGNALTTIEPCPSATSLTLAPITVSAQYQPVSTCEPSTACVKGKCSTIYPFTTYPYVSTVVPCAWNGTTMQTTTVTQVSQLVTASEHLETLTRVTAAPSIHKRNRVDGLKWQQNTTEQVTIYETVTRRAMAPFSAIGPLAIPDWDGSGLCSQCTQDDGSRAQLFAVVECRSGTDESGQPYQNCLEWYETLLQQPSTTVPAEAFCSSTGTIPQAGVYTWTFPQVAPPVTITRSLVTVTAILDGQPMITTQPDIQIIPDQPWNAYVTKSFQGPTTFDFEIFVTKVFVWDVPPVTSSAESSRNIPVPTASPRGGDNDGNAWWPLPEGDTSLTTSSGGDNVWEDWNPTSSVAVSSNSNSIRTSASTSVSSAAIGPISGATSSSLSSTTASISLSSSSNTVTAITSSSSSSTNAASGSNSSASSSSSSMSSSVSGSTSATSSVTTASTTSTSSIVPSGTGFYLQISGTPVAGLSPRQTVVQYVAFDSNNDAIAVNGISEAAEVFKGNDNTTFFSNDRFLGTATFTESVVQRFLDFPTGFAVWDIIGIFAHLRNTAGFCFENGLIYAYTDTDICENPINIIPTNPSTTSTATSTSTSTPSSSTLTSSASNTSSAGTVSTSAVNNESTTSSTSAVSTTTSTGTSTASTNGSVGPISASTQSSASSSASAISSTSGSFTTTPTSTSNSGPTNASSTLSTSSASSLAVSSSSSSASATASASTSSSGSSSTNSVSSTDTSSSVGTGSSSSTSYTGTASSSFTGTPSTSSASSTSTPSPVSSASSSGSISSSLLSSSITSTGSPSTTSVASTTTFTSTTASSTTSGGTTTTASATPICNLNANVCLNSQLITANTVATADCPLLDGILCSTNDLLALVPQLLDTNPDVASVLIGNNEVLGLSITPEELSAAINAGELNGVCDALGGPISVIINDPTCPNPDTTTSTSSTTASTGATTTSTSVSSSASTTSQSTTLTTAASTTSSVSSSTGASQSTTLTTATTTTTTSSATTTTTTATTSASPTCNLNINVCLDSTLLTANTVATYNCPLLDGILCSTNDLLAAIPQLLDTNPNIASVLIGNNEVIGLSLTPEQVTAALASGELTGVCDALGGPTSVILQDPTCPNPDAPTAT